MKCKKYRDIKLSFEFLYARQKNAVIKIKRTKHSKTKK